VKPSHTVRPVFDDPNLVSAAGLVPALRLAESAGLYELLEAVTVPSPNASVKTSSVVGGMLAGADSIDDMDLLRHGGMGRLFGGVRAPSTLGTFLRSFTHGHVQQLDKVSAGLLAGLSERVPGLFAGADEIAFLDVDDTVREVHGYAKQGAAFGYTGVRGLNLQLATISTPTAAPVILSVDLRGWGDSALTPVLYDMAPWSGADRATSYLAASDILDTIIASNTADITAYTSLITQVSTILSDIALWLEEDKKQ